MINSELLLFFFPKFFTVSFTVSKWKTFYCYKFIFPESPIHYLYFCITIVSCSYLVILVELIGKYKFKTFTCTYLQCKEHVWVLFRGIGWKVSEKLLSHWERISILSPKWYSLLGRGVLYNKNMTYLGFVGPRGASKN